MKTDEYQFEHLKPFFTQNCQQNKLKKLHRTSIMNFFQDISQFSAFPLILIPLNPLSNGLHDLLHSSFCFRTCQSIYILSFRRWWWLIWNRLILFFPRFLLRKVTHYHAVLESSNQRHKHVFAQIGKYEQKQNHQDQDSNDENKLELLYSIRSKQFSWNFLIIVDKSVVFLFFIGCLQCQIRNYNCKQVGCILVFRHDLRFLNKNKNTLTGNLKGFRYISSWIF